MIPVMLVVSVWLVKYASRGGYGYTRDTKLTEVHKDVLGCVQGHRLEVLPHQYLHIFLVPVGRDLLRVAVGLWCRMAVCR